MIIHVCLDILCHETPIQVVVQSYHCLITSADVQLEFFGNVVRIYVRPPKLSQDHGNVQVLELGKEILDGRGVEGL